MQCRQQQSAHKPILLPFAQWKSWPDRIRHFTPAWHAVIMGTGVVSALLNDFPYGQDSSHLKVAGCIFFLLNLVLFIFVCVCSVLRYVMYPDVFWLMIGHPAQSLFIGCFPMGLATLINSALVLNQNWDFGGERFLYTLWGLWWLDIALSYLVAYGMIYTMVVRHEHSLSNMAAVWLLPVVPLVVVSSVGGLLSSALTPFSSSHALITTALSLSTLAMGLAFALMMITIYLLRLIIRGIPDPGVVLSAFIVLGPLGQGGFSLLANGSALSVLLPLHPQLRSSVLPDSMLFGQMIYTVCLCSAYALWSVGIAWIVIAVCSIYHVAGVQRAPLHFGMAYWGLVFPNGVFALLTGELAKVLDSGFFRAVAALWSALVFVLWGTIFLRSVPAFIDGSLFKAPCLPDGSTVSQLLPIVQPHTMPPIGVEKSHKFVDSAISGSLDKSE